MQGEKALRLAAQEKKLPEDLEVDLKDALQCHPTLTL